MRVLAMVLVGLLSVQGASVGKATQSQNEQIEAGSLPVRASMWTREPSDVWMVQQQLISKIRGMSVENRDGQPLGRVQDFLLDSVSGEVRYVVISFGGWLGLGKRMKAVPAKIVSTATAKVGVVSLDAGRRRWQKAPLFNRDDLNRLATDPAFAQSLDDYFLAPKDARPAPPFGAPHSKPSLNASTSKSTGLIFSSELLGRQVLDRTARNIGKISDLLIDLIDRRPSLLIFQATKDLEPSAYALGLRAFKGSVSGPIVLNVPVEAFSNAPVLNDSLWRRSEIRSAVNIFRYPATAKRSEPQSSMLPAKRRQEKLAAFSLPRACTLRERQRPDRNAWITVVN